MQKTSGGKRSGTSWREWLRSLLVLVAAAACTELVLHLCVFHTLGWHIVYPLLFAALYGAVAALLSSLLPAWPGRILAALLMLGFGFLAEVQLIYHAIFGSFLSLSMIGLGGDVLDSFSAQLLFAMRRILPSILILAVPALTAVVLCIIKRLSFRMRWSQRLSALLIAIAIAVGSTELMVLTQIEPVPALELLRSESANTDVSYQHLGMTATTAQELRFMLLGAESGEQQLTGELQAGKYDARLYNVLPELDFEALYDSTDDEELRALDSYFSGREPTRKNEYTGVMKDWNLITICAESFTPLLIDPELTPALYEMTHHNGFLFENYYGTYKSVTTNGEYTMNTGLYPDLSRTKTNSSFDVAAANYLPFCLGNALHPLGYETLAYHNYIGTFYNRNVTHPNMGYTFKSPDSGLDMPLGDPSSDLEMIRASVGDYLKLDRPFHAYYMTYSGHYYYNWNNEMSAKNRSQAEGRYPSETVQAFVACNLELEYALEYLLDALEDAGKLDTTCIVLTNDHYPYGLSEGEYNELAGHKVDTVFERFRNAFICYAPGLGEDIPVEAFCSTADILPTLLNLFGVEYDSRLLAGVDALSDAEHIAVLSDESFLTEGFRFDAATGTVTGDAPDSKTLARLRSEVRGRFTASTQMLNHDYYRHVFDEIEREEAQKSPAHFEDLEVHPEYAVYYQAAIMYMLERDLVVPIRESWYGIEDSEQLDRFVDTFYRLEGSPEVTPDAMPERWAEAAADSPFYDALCWAFETGVLREDDPDLAPESGIGYQTCALLLYRYALYAGLADELTAEETAEFEALRASYPNARQEKLRALVWCFDHAIIRVTRNLDTTAALGDEDPVIRGRTTTYLSRICMLKEQQG